MKPSKLPRGCRPTPPQLAAERNGTFTFDQSGDAIAVVAVVERMREQRLGEVDAVALEFVGRERLRPGHEFAGDTAAVAAFADAMLDRPDAEVVHGEREGREDAAVVGVLAVVVGRAFPDAHGGEVRRLQRRDVPLVGGEIGDAVEADLAVRPRLHAGPFDAVVQILGLAHRLRIEEARRAAGAARIDAHDGVTVRHPFFRIDDLEVRVFGAGAFEHVGMHRDKALPGILPAILEREPLAVGAVAQDDGVAAGRRAGERRRRAARCRRPS